MGATGKRGEKACARPDHTGIVPPAQRRLKPSQGGPTLTDVEHIRHVLCAIELSASAETPLREADRIARRLGARLTVLHVVPDGYPGVPMLPEGAEQSLLEQQKLLREVGDYLADMVGTLTGRRLNDVDIEVEAGVPHDVIVQTVQELAVGLVVVGASGQDGTQEPLLGSVALYVARHAPASVLATRPRRVGGHAVAATDFSEVATLALKVAYDEARDRHAPLLIMHCFDRTVPDLVIGDPGIAPAVTVPDPAAAEAERNAIQTRLSMLLDSVPGPGETLVIDDPPTVAIVSTCKRVGADLVVVGASKKSKLGRLILGSVADAVVRGAPCSVLVVRKPQHG